MNIVIIGVGYVGLVTGLGLAKLNHTIQFLDIDFQKIDRLKNKISPFYEPELENYLNDIEIISKCSFESEYNEINWDDADIVMICVQTPSSINNEVDTSYLVRVFESIAEFVDKKTVVCIKSTIHPEAINSTINSSKFSNDQIAFNPEFLREGSAFQDFFNPDRIVIGANKETTAKKIALLYKDIDSKIISTDPVSSQLIKYLSNAYLPLRLSFVNEASQVINKLGGNLNETLEGIGLDTRIGKQYFRPSPGWGGSCFPKDVAELNSIVSSQDLNTPLISNIIESNTQHQIWFAEYLINQKRNNNLKNIYLIGLAFKEDTDDTRCSPTIFVHEILKSKKENVHIFDLSTYFSKEYDLHSEFKEDSLIVEMYPLNDKFSMEIKNKLNQINKFKYLRYWE